MAKKKRGAAKAKTARTAATTATAASSSGLGDMFSQVANVVAAEEEPVVEQENSEDQAGDHVDGGVGQHKDELERLKNADPEFYNFLQKNDSKLLDFGDGEESESATDDDDGSSTSESDADGDQETRNADESDDEGDDTTVLRLDAAEVKALEAQLGSSDAATLRAAKVIIRAFRAGCLMSSSTASAGPLPATKKRKQKKPKKEEAETDPLEDIEIGPNGSLEAHGVFFASGNTYQRVMTVSAHKAVHIISKQLGCPSTDVAKKSWVAPASARSRKALPIIKSYGGNLLSLTQGVKNEPTLRLLLDRCQDLIPYFSLLPKLGSRLIRVAISRWASECETSTFVRALILLKAIVSRNDPDRIELILKWSYRSYTSVVASKCNLRTLERIELAASSLVELHGADFACSYSHAFLAIRQLALDLRAALSSKENADVQKVHNWQYINSLRLWGQVLSAYPAEDQLQPLIYPYTQVTLAVMRLVPVPKNFGVRFQCGGFLAKLASSSGTYIPLAPLIIESLVATEIKRTLGGSTPNGSSSLLKSTDWRVTLRVPETSLGTLGFAESVVRQACLLLSMYFSSLSRHAAFPEAALPALVHLKRTLKATKVPALREELRSLVTRLEENSKLVTDRRAASGVTPQTASQSGFLTKELNLDSKKATPMESLATSLQQRVRNEAKVLDASTAEPVDDENEATKEIKKRKTEPKKNKRAKAAAVLTQPIDLSRDEDIVAPLSSDDDTET